MYGFPQPESEDERMSKLLTSLQTHLGALYTVENSAGRKKRVAYCQFSGGGDLCVSKKSVNVPLVFVSQTYDDDDDNNSTSSTYTPTTFSPPASVTPPSKEPLGLFIEGKKDNTAENVLKLQLWANMVVATITIFKHKIQKSQLTKQDLFGHKLLTGYGIACTGNGMVRMYKLEMKFQNGETKFITK